MALRIQGEKGNIEGVPLPVVKLSILTLPRARLGRYGSNKWEREAGGEDGLLHSQVMISSTEPPWQLTAVEILEGLVLLAWIIGHTLRKFSDGTKGSREEGST